jgi:PDDEXK-like domain of unknown function (DUF3799)
MTTQLQWRSGASIVMPGWYDGVPISVYHSNRITAEPSVSSSGLRTLWRKSPKHFYASWPYNPHIEEEDDAEESAAFTIGRAAHHLYLGEDDFSLQFIERPAKLSTKDGYVAWNGNRTEAITFMKQQKAAGRTVLTPNDVKKIRAMARSLAEEPLAIDLLQGAVEQTLIAKDEETGLWLKARPDVIPTSDGMFADLKTTQSVVDIDLKWTMREYGYNQQGALIWEICEMLGMPFDGFVLIFIEKKSPYCTRIVELTDDDLGRGRAQNRAMLRRIRKCLDSGSWPGPGKADAELFSIPQAEQEFIDMRLAMEEAA